LPPEIARQIHPDRRKNEDGYWAVRDHLRAQYDGSGSVFANGKVIAAGSSPVAVFHAAEASGQHPFLICVGKRNSLCRIRPRRISLHVHYAGEALPLIRVEFRPTQGTAGMVFGSRHS
jgi:hypothetical protein